MNTIRKAITFIRRVALFLQLWGAPDWFIDGDRIAARTAWDVACIVED